MDSVEKSQIQKNKITSSVAFLIAVISLVVAIWEGMESRAHNRLSVKPFLIIDRTTNTSTDEDGNILESSCTLTLHNRGLGPAVIRTFEIVVGNNNYDNWSDAIKAAGSSQPVPLSATFDAKDVIDEDYSKSLVTYSIQDELKPMELHIKYESIYEDVFDVRQQCHRS